MNYRVDFKVGIQHPRFRIQLDGFQLDSFQSLSEAVLMLPGKLGKADC